MASSCAQVCFLLRKLSPACASGSAAKSMLSPCLNGWHCLRLLQQATSPVVAGILLLVPLAARHRVQVAAARPTQQQVVVLLARRPAHGAAWSCVMCSPSCG